MKKIIFLLATFAIALLLGSSCKKEEVSPNKQIEHTCSATQFIKIDTLHDWYSTKIAGWTPDTIEVYRDPAVAGVWIVKAYDFNYQSTLATGWNQLNGQGQWIMMYFNDDDIAMDYRVGKTPGDHWIKYKMYNDQYPSCTESLPVMYNIASEWKTWDYVKIECKSGGWVTGTFNVTHILSSYCTGIGSSQSGAIMQNGSFALKIPPQ